jgi:hypothetical protein
MMMLTFLNISDIYIYIYISEAEEVEKPLGHYNYMHTFSKTDEGWRGEAFHTTQGSWQQWWTWKPNVPIHCNSMSSLQIEPI